MIKDYRFFKEDYQDNISIEILNKNFVNDIRKAAFETIGKKIVSEKPMSEDLFFKYLISEHSPIRKTLIEIRLEGIYYPTSVHFSRHGMCTHYVETSRRDRTKENRSLQNPVNHTIICNIQNLIDMARKRLCEYHVMLDTFNWMKSIKMKFLNHKDNYYNQIGKVMVPNCIYRGGCPEFSTCRKFDTFLTKGVKIRYNEYNMFY